MTKSDKKIVTFNISAQIIDKAKSLVANSDKFRNRSHLVETLINEEFKKMKL